MPKALVDFLTVPLNGVTLAALYFITEVAITENMRRFKRITRAVAAS